MENYCHNMIIVWLCYVMHDGDFDHSMIKHLLLLEIGAHP